MDSLVSKRSIDKEVTNDILKIGVEARKASETNHHAINATVGMFYDDNGDFIMFDSVINKFKSLAPETYLPYTSTPGGDDFTEALAKWILRSNYAEYQKSFHYDAIATPGGSGAISATFENYAENNDEILIPNICWDPYYIMIREQNATPLEYNLFDEAGNFNLVDFKEKVEYLANKQQRVLVLINDPCQNPTGYSLSKAEWEAVIEILNACVEQGVPTILFYDMAYIDYHRDGLDASRESLEVFKQASQDLLIICGFSGSKTLSFYGVRIGAMFAISKNKQIIKEFRKIISFSARGRWSSSSHIGIRTLVELVNDAKALATFEEELGVAVLLLSKRGELFMKEAKEVNLDVLPYKSGFFITLPNCSKEVYDALIANAIYTIPLSDTLIRIAVSSVPTDKIVGLATKIQKLKENIM